MPDDVLMRLKDIAHALRCSEPTARAKTREPGFPAARALTKRRRVWIRADVEDYIQRLPLVSGNNHARLEN